jgi:cysteine synthase
LEMAARQETREEVIVGIFADTGQRYLSVEGLFDL